MEFDVFEHKFICPYCQSEVSVFLDPSVSKQKYYEDCEICCNAIEITCEFADGELTYFDASCEQ